MKIYVKSSTDNPYFIDQIIETIKDTYESLKNEPVPESYSQLDSYYGSRPLYTTKGNMLELIEDGPVEVYSYGTTFNYKHAWVIKIGGAYNSDATKYLRDYIKAQREQIFNAGYAIIDSYGTNYCLYGIAKR